MTINTGQEPRHTTTPSPTQEPPPRMTNRLIEEWLPIAELGEESMRERHSMTVLPPIS